MTNHEKLISDYLEAYAAANPTLPQMSCVYRGGYYRFRDASGWSLSPVRGSKLIEMTERLRKRAEAVGK